MCEFCGCGVGKAEGGRTKADRVPPTLATIFVKVIEPTLKSDRVRQPQSSIRRSPLPRAPRSP